MFCTHLPSSLLTQAHYLLPIAILVLAANLSAADRPLVWIDACEGEPADYAKIIEDLGKARVVYLGERHTVERHHATQAKVIADLAAAGQSLVVALEPLEISQQPSIDRFNRGEIDFAGLAAAIDWAKRWPNYEQYRPVLECRAQGQGPGDWAQSRPGSDPRGGAVGRCRQARCQSPQATSRGDGDQGPAL